jgi:putative oxidoreductase
VAERRVALLAWTVAIWAARIGVAITFLVAAVPKVIDLEPFAIDIRNYQVFPEWSLHLLAAIVPMVEIVGAVAIASGRERWVRSGAVVLGLLTAAFVALVASVIIRGIDLQCGCFGQDETASAVGVPTLVRDVGLLAAIAIAACRVPRRASARQA